MGRHKDQHLASYQTIPLDLSPLQERQRENNFLGSNVLKTLRNLIEDATDKDLRNFSHSMLKFPLRY